MAWINELTDMADWQHRIWDNDFVFEWKSAKVMTGGDVTRSMADWVMLSNCSVEKKFTNSLQCVDEVRYYVPDSVSIGIIPAIDGGVIKSDDCVAACMRKDLLKAIAQFKSIRTTQRNRSADQIDQVVDPFLYPFSWEKTRAVRSEPVSRADCIPRSGEGLAEKVPPVEDCKQELFVKYRNDIAWSRWYQWLPFDVTIGTDGEGPIR